MRMPAGRRNLHFMDGVTSAFKPCAYFFGFLRDQPGRLRFFRNDDLEFIESLRFAEQMKC
jgi:hypothetical protein